MHFIIIQELQMHLNHKYIPTTEPYFLLLTLDRNMIEQLSSCHFIVAIVSNTCWSLCLCLHYPQGRSVWLGLSWECFWAGNLEGAHYKTTLIIIIIIIILNVHLRRYSSKWLMCFCHSRYLQNVSDIRLHFFRSSLSQQWHRNFHENAK